MDEAMLTDGVVLLRPWRTTDAPEVHAACQDPLIARFIPVPQPYTEADARTFVEARRADWDGPEERPFAIVDAGSGRLLGSIARHGSTGPHAAFGYWLAPGARRRGVATRALRLLVDWTLRTTVAIRLELFTDVDNDASGRVAERAGFAREGTRRAWYLDPRDPAAGPRDAVFYVRVRGDHPDDPAPTDRRTHPADTIAGVTKPSTAPSPTAAPGPLAGLLVADCSTVLAGPYCTMLLADLGADVIKVEPPEGDGTRGWGPPWVGAGLAGPDDPGTAAYYLAVNRNKRSIRLDLKRPDGAEVLRRLLARSDLLVENFRVGGLDRLGFGDAELERINPRLVHLAISGYGPTGPDRDRPGYDFILQAEAGLMSITGAPDEAGGGPTKVGVAIADVVTGLLGAVSALAALVGRERADSPAADRGQRIDVSLLEATLAVLVNQAQNAFVTGRAPVRRGNAHPNIVPYETFATADGEIAVAVGSERQWPRFCAALGLDALAADPRFRTNGARVEHRDELRPLLAARLAERRSTEWLAALDGAEVPAAPINDLLAAFDHPQARARGMTVDVEHPLLGPLRQVGLPFDLSATPASIRSAPPLLGEHADAILGELGYDRSAIAALRADGVV